MLVKSGAWGYLEMDIPPFNDNYIGGIMLADDAGARFLSCGADTQINDAGGLPIAQG